MKRLPSVKSVVPFSAGVVCWFLFVQSVPADNSAAESPSKIAARSDGSSNRVEIPWVKGAFRHVLDPPGKKSDPQKRKSYVNWFGNTGLCEPHSVSV